MSSVSTHGCEIYTALTVAARHASATKSDVATVRVQEWWRMASAVFSYRPMWVCTIVLQSVYRGGSARQYHIRL
jgi:hypothetical protein